MTISKLCDLTEASWMTVKYTADYQQAQLLYVVPLLLNSDQ